MESDVLETGFPGGFFPLTAGLWVEGQAGVEWLWWWL